MKYRISKKLVEKDRVGVGWFSYMDYLDGRIIEASGRDNIIIDGWIIIPEWLTPAKKSLIDLRKNV
jgi:hypothetical protein